MAIRYRLKEIDIVRGITIFLVVLGHSGMSAGILTEILKDFRMPLFFIISGYLFSNSKYLDNMSRLINDKFRALIIPYISFCLMSGGVLYLIQIINGQEIDWFKPLIGMVYGNGNWIAGNVPVWFLVCLFSAFIIYNLVLRYTNKNTILIRIIAFSVLGIIGYEISKILWLPMSFDIALTAVLFMFFGYFLKEKQILLNHRFMLEFGVRPPPR